MAAGALRSPSHPIGTYPDPKGAIWGLTILIDFSDTAPAFTKAQVEAWLNQRGYREGGLNGSIRDYFFDNSNGVVDFQNQVVGFYRASQPKNYNEADTGYSRASALVNEAVAAIDAEVDFRRSTTTAMAARKRSASFMPAHKGTSVAAFGHTRVRSTRRATAFKCDAIR